MAARRGGVLAKDESKVEGQRKLELLLTPLKTPSVLITRSGWNPDIICAQV